MTDSSLPDDAEAFADDIDALAADIATADHVAALTGAGISTASGLPSFRGEDGIWGTEFDPADFQYSRFQSDPAGFRADRIDLQDRLFGGGVEPNAAAGSERVLELHGNAQRAVCASCGTRVDAEPVFERARNGETPPRCDACDGVLKPDVVLFGQSMPEGALGQAQHHARDADVFLAVGSSLTVQPAASLPQVSSNRGATVAVVNLEETGLSGSAAYDIRADVTAVLPALAARVRRRWE